MTTVQFIAARAIDRVTGPVQTRGALDTRGGPALVKRVTALRRRFDLPVHVSFPCSGKQSRTRAKATKIDAAFGLSTSLTSALISFWLVPGRDHEMGGPAFVEHLLSPWA